MYSKFINKYDDIDDNARVTYCAKYFIIHLKSPPMVEVRSSIYFITQVYDIHKGDKLMKRLFVSVPMRGRTDQTIRHSIEEMHKIAEIAFGEKLEVIDSYFDSTDVEVKNWSIYYLSESIKAMADADYFIGVDSWNGDMYFFRGCDVERNIARYYDIPSISLNVRDYAFFNDIFTIGREEYSTCCEQETKK